MSKQKILSVAINQYFSAVAKANNVDSTAQMFNVDPVQSQKMKEAIQESSAFLRKINIAGKTEKHGEIIGLSTGLLASNTDTSSKERQPHRIYSLSGRTFLLEQTNFDTAIAYNDLDQWAHLKTFPTLVNKKITESIGRSLISIGFNGIRREKDTDIKANPLLQDVAKGWLQKLREENKERVMTGLKIGPTEETKSLDAAVEGAINEMIADEFADRDDLVVICNKRLLGDKYFNLINAAGEKATEVQASDVLKGKRNINGLAVETPPFFPQNTILITPLANLSIYYQKDARRRQLIDNPKKDQIEHYQSDNIDFIVEEYGAAVLIDGIEIVAAANNNG